MKVKDFAQYLWCNTIRLIDTKNDCELAIVVGNKELKSFYDLDIVGVAPAYRETIGESILELFVREN